VFRAAISSLEERDWVVVSNRSESPAVEERAEFI
jgi:hypothetical protein